jgi:hypothetical protein
MRTGLLSPKCILINVSIDNKDCNQRLLLKTPPSIIMEDGSGHNDATFVLTPDEFLEIGLKLVNWLEKRISRAKKKRTWIAL